MSKGQDSTVVGLRLPDVVIEELRVEAEKENLSVGLWIKKLVEDLLGWKPELDESESLESS